VAVNHTGTASVGSFTGGVPSANVDAEPCPFDLSWADRRNRASVRFARIEASTLSFRGEDFSLKEHVAGAARSGVSGRRVREREMSSAIVRSAVAAPVAT
jgi:hypothetical protein